MIGFAVDDDNSRKKTDPFLILSLLLLVVKVNNLQSADICAEPLKLKKEG